MYFVDDEGELEEGGCPIVNREREGGNWKAQDVCFY